MAKATDTSLATTPVSLAVQSLGDCDFDGAAVDVVVFQCHKVTDGLCFIYARYGQDAHKCASNLCKMRKNIKTQKKPRTSGNAPAGSQ